MTPALELSNAHLSFAGRPVLQGLNLSVPSGQMLVICGKSGCGKSTLLRVAAGLQGLDSGTVRLGGIEATSAGEIGLPPEHRKISMVFQDLGLWPHLTALENAALGLVGQSISRRERHEMAASALSACGLGTRLSAKPSQLSGGERQRIALARAFATSPSLLLLDEPFASLDLLAKQETAAPLHELSAQSEVTVIISIHDPFDAMNLHAQRLVVLDGGKISEDLPFSDLQNARPASEILQVWQARLSRHQIGY